MTPVLRARAQRAEWIDVPPGMEGISSPMCRRGPGWIELDWVGPVAGVGDKYTCPPILSFPLSPQIAMRARR